jgi:hypothetical protein
LHQDVLGERADPIQKEPTIDPEALDFSVGLWQEWI